MMCRSHLRNGWGDFLHIWDVDFPTWPAHLYQIWFQLDKGSHSYICVKIMFSFFLSVYCWCGLPASWVIRHTTMCLEFQSDKGSQSYTCVKITFFLPVNIFIVWRAGFLGSMTHYYVSWYHGNNV